MENQTNNRLANIGILVFNGFLANEVVAPLDVFTKAKQDEYSLFNVLLIAETEAACISEEGLKIIPDATIATCPDLDVLVVPGSNNPDEQTQNQTLIDFIRAQNDKTSYTASHCAGAFILGEAGAADGKQVVTYCGGSEQLQKDYPGLIVQDDQVHSVVSDGKIISSNGNLVSYLASLQLLELLAGTKQRKQVEEELLIHKLN